MPVLRYRTMVALLAFYCCTWLVGGVALLFLMRSLGDDPGWSTVPYLGGAAAVGAIVSVLTIVAPSGLGVREASTYGLLLPVTTEGVALGVTVLNRLAITLVEAVLLGVGLLIWKVARPHRGSVLARAGPRPRVASRARANRQGDLEELDARHRDPEARDDLVAERAAAGGLVAHRRLVRPEVMLVVLSRTGRVARSSRGSRSRP